MCLLCSWLVTITSGKYAGRYYNKKLISVGIFSMFKSYYYVLLTGREAISDGLLKVEKACLYA